MFALIQALRKVLKMFGHRSYVVSYSIEDIASKLCSLVINHDENSFGTLSQKDTLFWTRQGFVKVRLC